MIPLVNIGIAGFGTYFPATVETTADLVTPTGIPEAVLRDKMGIRQRHIASDADSVVTMATHAAHSAIADAGIDPALIDLVISHGSEYKDHLVWNAAAKIQHNVGAVNAYAFEMYALCAGAPIALNTARALMQTDPRLRYVLLAAASRENDLVSLTNQRARFMFNFGAGGGAMILQRDADRNLILGAAAITDASLSETVVLTHDEPAPPSVVPDLRGQLDVTDGDTMARRLSEVSLPNFERVIRDAVAQSGASMADVRFLGLTHMKRSFFYEIVSAIGLTPDQTVYLEDHGHVQSVDQVLALQLGLAQGKIKPGDLIVLAGAGVGYTWSAIAVRWG